MRPTIADDILQMRSLAEQVLADAAGKPELLCGRARRA